MIKGSLEVMWAAENRTDLDVYIRGWIAADLDKNLPVSEERGLSQSKFFCPLLIEVGKLAAICLFIPG